MSSIPSGQQPQSAASAVPSSKPEKLWMWIEGGESNQLANKVMKDVGTVFQEFKEKLVAKLNNEAKSKILWDENTINIDINLKTKKVEIQLKSDPTSVMTLDLRSMEKSAQNSALWDTAKKIEHLLRDHKLLIETKDSLDSHADAIFKHELAPRKGEDGFTKSINRLPVHDVTAEMMKNAKPTGKEKGSLGLCHKLIESSNSSNSIDVPGVKNKIAEAMNQQEKILNQNLAFLKKQLENRKSDIEKGTDERVLRDAKLLEKQIAEYENVPTGLLQLVLTLRELDGQAIPTRFDMKDTAENIYKVIIQLFERDEHIGVSATGKDGKAKHVITREHEKLAAIIAAAATFSHTIVPNDPSAPKEYAKHFQDGYQKFLDRHLVDPNTHLGVIGSLLRLETVDEITSDDDIKDTEIRSLVDTRGMSSTLVDQINGHLRGLFPSSAAAHHISTIPPSQSQPGAAGAAASVVPVGNPTRTPRRGGRPPLVPRPPAGHPPVVQGQRVASAAPGASATPLANVTSPVQNPLQAQAHREIMNDRVVDIQNNQLTNFQAPIGLLQRRQSFSFEPQQDFSLKVGQNLRTKLAGTSCKIGYGIAGSSAGPWGLTANVLREDPSSNEKSNGYFGLTVAGIGSHKVIGHEESTINEWLKTKCDRIRLMNLNDQKEEINRLVARADTFYNAHPNIDRGYAARDVAALLTSNSKINFQEAKNDLLLKRLIFAAYAKDRYGMKQAVGSSTSKEAFFGSAPVDYNTGNVKPDVYSRAFAHSLEEEDGMFIYAAAANADNKGTPQGGMKRTFNSKAQNDYSYMRKTIYYALVGQLKLAAENGCTDFIACKIGTGIYAGPHKDQINREFNDILNEALQVTVTLNGANVPLGSLFNKVILAGAR